MCVCIFYKSDDLEEVLSLTGQQAGLLFKREDREVKAELSSFVTSAWQYCACPDPCADQGLQYVAKKNQNNFPTT